MSIKNPHAQALGKLGGSVRSEKKKKSSRLNGKKGGRPKKVYAIPEMECVTEMLNKLTIIKN